MMFVFQLLLNFVHLLFSLYYFLQQQCERFLLFIEQRGFLSKVPCDSFVNSKKLTETSKIPKHLAVLLGHEEASILDLVKLVSWSIAAEIPYVSFYDYKGVLQKNTGLFKQKLEELEPIITQNIEWSNHSNNTIDSLRTIKEKTKVKTNGICTNIINSDTTEIMNKFKTKVQVLSYSDGKEKVINLTKSLAKVIDLNILQVEDITPQLIDEKLSLNGRIPDPDLAIMCGNTMCTYGFLPWQSRITQFFIIPSHHNISSTIFYETLIEYSKCQQRYGK